MAHLPSLNRKEFIDQVLSFVKFPFDKEKIRLELTAHIEDKEEFYITQGYDEDKAEDLSIQDMGDAMEIGYELNKEHNPFLGWLWVISNWIVVFFGFVCTIIVVLPLLFSIFQEDFSKRIPEANIAYKTDVYEKLKIDDRVIKFTEVIYTTDGDLNIYYEYYDTRHLRSGWSFDPIKNITDNLDNMYREYSGSQNSLGFKTIGVTTIEKFSDQATVIIIDYDQYNRSYHLEIPIKVGANNESN